MKHSLSLPKLVKLLLAVSLFVVAFPLLNSCGDSTNNASSADSATMSTADSSAPTMSAPMQDSNSMKTDTIKKDVVGSKDKPPPKPPKP